MDFVVRANTLGYYQGLRQVGAQFTVPEAEFTRKWSWVDIVSGEFPKPIEVVPDPVVIAPESPAVEEPLPDEDPI